MTLDEKYCFYARAGQFRQEHSAADEAAQASKLPIQSRCIELYNSGLSLVAVGQKLGIDQATVRRTLLSRGVERRDRMAD